MDHLLPLKLKIEVLRARNLTASDVNGKSDPYCRVTLGNKTFSTTVQPNTLDPEWQQSVAFINDVLAPFTTLQETNDTCSYKILLLGYLLVEIWDHDFGNPDDFIGRLVIPLASLPLARIESNKEQWHMLRRNSTSNITGEILLNISLESVEDDLSLSNDKLTNDYLIVSKALGYQLPLLVNNKLIDYPGARESVEIGFSKVYVQQGPVSVEAMLLLTNYRLIILSTSDSRNTTNLTANTTIAQPSLSNDLNMWIALNNISSVERGGNSTVVRRHHVTGEAENVESATLNINCFDCRHLQIVFVMNSEGNGVSVVRASDHPVPSKILQKVKRSRRKAIKRLKKLKGIKKKTSKIQVHDRQRSGAFFEEDVVDIDPSSDLPSTDIVPSMTVGPSLLEECSDFQLLDPGYNMNDGCTDSETDEDEYQTKTPPEPTELMIKDDDNDDGIEEEGPLIINDDDLELAYNGLVLPVPTKLLVNSFILRLEDVAINISDYPPALYDWSHDQDWYKQESSRISADDSLLDKWDVNTVLCKDMQRLMNDKWRECAVNSQRYTLCSSYPRYIFIPAPVHEEKQAQDELELGIEEVAKFRSRGRVPSLVWLDKVTGSFLLRSAQPLTGTAGKHCKEDEELIKSAISCGPVGGGMTIFDARSFAAVQGNKLKGKGTEDPANYPGCKLVYLDIPNIHAVRDSYEALKALVFSSSSNRWLSNLENTQWLAYISLILKGASLIARYLGYQKGSALVHCSDGWDRTSQLTSLTQLMLDPFYRTIDGFMILIDKEWLAYGHKFGDRLGHPLHLNERSPIFLQFLDCTHQMVHQQPSLFEFTESLLLCIAEHINTRWFGTFLYNCDKERKNKHIYTRTLSLWSHIQATKETFRNAQFCPTNENLISSWSVRRLKLWDSYFLLWDNTVSVIPSNTETDLGAGLGAGLETDMVGGTDTPDNNGQLGGDHSEFDTVVWMANDKASSCLMCHQKFTFTRRKHHCRNCGRIYCNDCSKHRLSLDHLGYTEPVRVCDNCFRIQTSHVTQQATNNLETHQEDGFQILEVKTNRDSVSEYNNQTN